VGVDPPATAAVIPQVARFLSGLLDSDLEAEPAGVTAGEALIGALR
jgi:hypothetical protein